VIRSLTVHKRLPFTFVQVTTYRLSLPIQYQTGVSIEGHRSRLLRIATSQFKTIVMLLPLELSATGQWPAVRRFCDHRVRNRQLQVSTNVARLRAPLLALLKQVQSLEPRFACIPNGGITCHDPTNGSDWLSGLRAHSPIQFELPVYLQQLGVFSILEQSAGPGCVSLKLADGRKRSMSLWVEFITASGYLSARKIRARFAALVRFKTATNSITTDNHFGLSRSTGKDRKGKRKRMRPKV
jgi:hypothetical protein